MNPEFWGDVKDIAKLSMLRWLPPDHWGYEPMYFPSEGQEYDEIFPRKCAKMLGVSLISFGAENLGFNKGVASNHNGHLFIDPDTGLALTGEHEDSNKYLHMPDLIDIVSSERRRNCLTLVYDEGLDFRRQYWATKMADKVREIRNAGIHSNAYASRPAFLWASDNPNIITVATNSLLRLSGLPLYRLVDDGCGHISSGPSSR